MGVASASAGVLPDLVSDPPANPQLGVYADDTGGQRLLLRFDSYVHNVGPGPLEVRFGVSGPGGATDTAGAPEQVVAGEADARAMPGAEVVFETGRLDNEDGHDHWHLQRVARYALALPGGGTAASEKVGFCLLDSLPVEAASGRHYTSDCRRAPGAPTVTMGVSPGWRDLYTRNLAHQWVDVSGIAPGTYDLRAEVDPDGLIAEADEANPPSSRAVVVPGWVARPRAGERAVVLDAQAVAPASGALAPPRYRIEKAPEHGTVDKPIGVWFDDPVVRYTPADPSAPAVPDELEYAARAADSAFPHTPPRATVALGPGAGARVAIGGAPATLVAGTSVQLTAAAPEGAAVAWAASAGTITDGGLFTAPAVSGPVTVRASTDGGAADEVAIAVVAPPVPQPAPLPSTAPKGDSAAPPLRPLVPAPAPSVFPRRAIEKATAERAGRYVVVAVTPGRSGPLRIVLRRGSRTLRACVVRGVAGRSVTCRLRRPAASRGRGALRVVVRAGTVVRAVPVRAAHLH